MRIVFSRRNVRAGVLVSIGGCLYVVACGDSDISAPATEDAGRFDVLIPPPPSAPDAEPVRPWVVGGHEHACALLEDDSLRCWGRNSFGELGGPPVTLEADGGYSFDSGSITFPIHSAVAKASSVAVGGITYNKSEAATCIIQNGGKVSCWGADTMAALGRGPSSADAAALPHPEAVVVEELPPAKQIATNGATSCAITDAGDIWCWGTLPYRGTARTPIQVPLPNNHTATQISMGEMHICALLDDKTVACWGYNTFGQLGRVNPPADPNGATPFPTLVPSLTDVQQIVTGFFTTCALARSADVLCFGAGGNGNVGRDPGIESNPTPFRMPLPQAQSVTQIVAGRYHTCALLESGEVWCWGYNGAGQLASGEIDYDASRMIPDHSKVPLKVQGLPLPAKAIAAGYSFTCATLVDHNVWCWGLPPPGDTPGPTKRPDPRPDKISF